MGFADDLVADTRTHRPCRVETVRQQMAENDRKVFDAALANRETFGTGKIIRVVQSDPSLIRLGREAIDKHRNRTCVCYMEVS